MMELFYLIWAVMPIILISLPMLKRTERTTITKTVRAQSSGSFIRLAHGYTHYAVTGPEKGPVVVMIHGFSVPYYMWDQTFTALTQAGFRVIRYDLYGRGLSDRPKVTYNRNFFLRQLDELLNGLAVKEPVHLIATSMGGAIAAAFTASFPVRVKTVSLIDPWYEKWQIGLLKIPGIGEYLYQAFLLPAAPRKQLGDFVHPENFPEWPDRFQDQMVYQGFGNALLSTLRNFMTQDPTPDYRSIERANKPVLLIWGTEDQITPVNGAAKLQALLNPEFHWVEQTGHVPHYERPEVVNPYLINFLLANPGPELPVEQDDLTPSELRRNS